MSMRRLLSAAVGLVLLAGCESAPSATPGAATPASPAGTSLASAVPARDTVAAHFTLPRSGALGTWTRGGRPVVREEAQAHAGPAHCDWQSATMLVIGWPLGTVSRRVSETRQFVRDPRGVLPRSAGKPALAVDLPADARDTGYRGGPVELWLAPSDPRGAYLRVGTDVERWPLADPRYTCR